MEMHDQSQYDRRDGECYVRETSMDWLCRVEAADTKQSARPNGQAGLSRAPLFPCLMRVPI